jgi:hypothetical protein
MKHGLKKFDYFAISKVGEQFKTCSVKDDYDGEGKVEEEFGNVSCSDKLMKSIEIKTSHFNTVYALQKPTDLETIFTYFKKVSEKMESGDYKEYVKIEEEKQETGLTDYFSTEYYNLKSEGTNFHFGIKNSTPATASVSATFPADMEGLLFKAQAGVIGKINQGNLDLVFPAIYAKKKEEGAETTPKYVMKMFKFSSEGQKLICSTLKSEDQPKKDVAFQFHLAYPTALLADDYTWDVTVSKSSSKPTPKPTPTPTPTPNPKEKESGNGHTLLYLTLILILVGLGYVAFRYKQKMDRQLKWQETDSMSMNMDMEAHKYTY